MLLDMFEYATKLLYDNMTTTTTNTRTITSTDKSSNATTLPPSSSSASASPSSSSPATGAFNDSVKSLFNKTLAKVSKATTNITTDYTAKYAELPPFIAAHGPTGGELGATLAADMVTAAVTTLPTVATRHLIETSTVFPAQTVATFIASNKNRATTVIVYPTDYRSARAISLRPERSPSQGFTSLELDTVIEERCSDVEQTTTEILNAESPMETTSSCKMSFSS